MIVNKGGSFLLTSSLLEGALIHWSGPRRGGKFEETREMNKYMAAKVLTSFIRGYVFS